MKRAEIPLIALLVLSACTEGMSTNEVRTAAIDRAREEFNLPADAPLEATVWTGSEYDGEPAICGTVSSRAGGMPPQRFMARLEPFEWLVFQGAHDAMISAQPGKFPAWGQYCMDAATGRIATTENQTCGARMDANQNGRIEEAEYNSFGFAFDNWDTSNNYSVSAEEFARCWPTVAAAPPSDGLQLFDADGDGMLSQEEFFAADRFSRFAPLARP